MRVAYFSKTSAMGPASRYRIYQFLPYLEHADIQCAVYPLFESAYFKLLEIQSKPVRVVAVAVYSGVRFLKRLWDLVAVKRPELLVVEGQLFPYCPPWVEKLLVYLGHRVVIEFDDAIYLTRFHERKLPQLLNLSASVIVGNRTLAEYASRYSSSVTIVPTVVDTERFAPNAPSSTRTLSERDSRITIVWIGLAYNAPYLEALTSAIQRVQQEFHARFRVISSRPPKLKGIEVDFVPWEFRTEVERLQDCQIGIMPLPDSEWAKGKCGLKLLQYMAVGMAAVASPIGVNREIITPEENGLFATSPDDWGRQLGRLCRDASLRHQLGTAGRRTVEERYALNMWGPRLGDIYQSIVYRRCEGAHSHNQLTGEA